MKHVSLFLAALALGLALSACGGGEAYGRIQVSIVETAGLTVENNGQWIEPGENVEFLLTVSPGREISNVLYDGGCRLSAEGGRVRLELLGVCYPLRVKVELTQAEVTAIAAGAFAGCAARRVVLPPGLAAVEEGAFAGAALEELTLFDSIETVSDAAFADCARLRTLRINAVEDPYGYRYRRESLYADKVDMLINARGTRKLVFYGGGSMWYNLIGSEAAHAFPGYTVINMGLNGTVNSLSQMEILGEFLEEGDILFHTPELASKRQLLLDTDLHSEDDKLWCGLEYNYDLFALVDLRGMEGVFDSLAGYLQKKQPGGSYADEYKDASGNVIMDGTGSITLIRTQPVRLSDADEVTLDPAVLENGLPALARVYGEYGAKGVRVYVSYACVDRDALPPEQRDNGPEMERHLRELIGAMDGPAVISSLEDYFYGTRDFYDTHYHLLTPQAYGNTEKWLRDLAAQMAADGLTR